MVSLKYHLINFMCNEKSRCLYCRYCIVFRHFNFVGILTIVVDKWEWLKWNPISMMNIMVQIVDKNMKKIHKIRTA